MNVFATLPVIVPESVLDVMEYAVPLCVKLGLTYAYHLSPYVNVWDSEDVPLPNAAYSRLLPDEVLLMYISGYGVEPEAEAVMVRVYCAGL